MRHANARSGGGARGMREGGARSKHSTNAYGYQALQDLYLHGRAQAIRCGQWGETLRTAFDVLAASDEAFAFASCCSLYFSLSACFLCHFLLCGLAFFPLWFGEGISP